MLNVIITYCEKMLPVLMDRVSGFLTSMIPGTQTFDFTKNWKMILIFWLFIILNLFGTFVKIHMAIRHIRILKGKRISCRRRKFRLFWSLVNLYERYFRTVCRLNRKLNRYSNRYRRNKNLSHYNFAGSKRARLWKIITIIVSYLRYNV